MSQSDGRVRAVLVVSLLLLVCLYAVQLARPLHLESDSVCYLHVAELGAEGRGYTCPGCDRTHCSVQYPPGYPWVLAVLIRGGVATATSFVVINFACIAIALVVAASLWRRVFGLSRNTILGLAALLLLWWPVFRLANAPLSDFVFLALAMLSVLAATVSFEARERNRQYGALLVSAIIAVVAFKVRTVGIALAPMLLWAVVGRPEGLAWLRAQFAAHRTVIIGAFVVLLLAGLAVIRRSQYVTLDLHKQYGEGLGRVLLRTWGFRVTEFGEMTLNMPAGKIPGFVLPLLWALGAAAIAFILWLVWRRRSVLGPTEIFLLAVAGIMAIWPFKDARFWLPVLPILLGLVAWWIQTLNPGAIWRRLAPVAVGLWVVVGLAGEAYNTKISVSRDQFPLRFNDEYLGPVYREAWGLRVPADTLPVDSTALHVLRRFESRAHPR